MTFPLRHLTACLLLAGASLTTTPAWSQGHDHDDAPKEQKGPHGGKLVQAGDFDLEITVYETGIPPEMRIYAYNQGQPVAPDAVDLQILLGRLGGQVDDLSFSAEQDYLVSNQSVVEPHSFDVSINARYQGTSYNWDYANYEGRTEISDRLLKLSEVGTEVAGSQTLSFSDTLYGIVSPMVDRLFSVNAPYNGIIERLQVRIGDRVKAGQVIAIVRNSDTLQSYEVTSPADGEITELLLNAGDNTASSALVRLANLSRVWIDLSAFPGNIERMTLGNPVTIADNHGSEQSTSTISYLAPMMTGGHIARVRAELANPEGHWRPGMHVKAEVQTGSKTVPLAVRVDALQTFRDMPVVFARYGNTFEVRMVELGERDGDYVEVLGGLEPGTEYVTRNSYLMKADVLKDAAKHDH